MPPEESGKSLTKKEIEILQTWVLNGAPWTGFWAYEPPIRHSIPEATGDWSKNWIDQFVLSRLRKNGLQPSAEADRATLLRRLYLDLIGLPPSPEEVDAFVSDDSPNAYQNVVDRLLDSKHFGERLAIYWLDLVRFADTVGYHGDQDHNISPYRDWVINALNENMPFDQFTRQQLAGDLIPNSTLNQKIASGYNRLLQTSHEGGVQPKEYRAIYAADRVRNLSAVWMAATVGCAQCHDHKYDPYTSKDFYSLAAFFADINDEMHLAGGLDTVPTKRAPEIQIFSSADQQQLDQLEQQIGIARLQLDELQKNDVLDHDVSTQINRVDQNIKQLESERKEIDRRGTWTMITKSRDVPRTTRILPRGNWLDESGEIVGPAIPSFMGKIRSRADRPDRLDLADWLTDVDSGCGKLTARVFANRIWYLLMGVGICRSLDDFGGQGDPPVFPELLDNLAMEFVDRGWDIKSLIRTIVTSSTYRQSSVASDELLERDPYNQMFARQSRYRLPAELIRDNALAISGLLNADQIGGRSIKPYQPAGYYRHLNFPPRTYQPDTDANQYRRGVYVHWQRQYLHPSLKSLDAPLREECTARRPRSNTPLAALTLLNDPSFMEAARVFATRIIGYADQVDTRLDFAFRSAVARRPDPAERQILLDLLNVSRTQFNSNRQSTEKLLSTGQSRLTTEDDPIELVAWTTVARAILNLDETISRN